MDEVAVEHFLFSTAEHNGNLCSSVSICEQDLHTTYRHGKEIRTAQMKWKCLLSAAVCRSVFWKKATNAIVRKHTISEIAEVC